LLKINKKVALNCKHEWSVITGLHNEHKID
jgi:hypothetical protein